MTGMNLTQNASWRVLFVIVLGGIFFLAYPSAWAGENPATASVGDGSQSVTVATWNLEWFYDDFLADNSSDLSRQRAAPSRADWDWKRQSVARVIAELRPTILCLQEVENREVVYRLVREIEETHGIKYRYAFIDGFDFATDQDVAIIYQSGLVEYSRREQTAEMYDSGEFYNLSKHLIARFQWGSGEEKRSLVILNCHLRAMPEQFELRQRQGRLIHAWMSDLVSSGENVIVTGDFNSEVDFGTETAGSDLSIIRGLDSPSTDDDLRDAHEFLPLDRRVTHVSGRQYDRILYSRSLGIDDAQRKDLVVSSAVVRRDLVVQGAMDGQEHWDAYYQVPADERDLSDHYPLVVEFLVK